MMKFCGMAVSSESENWIFSRWKIDIWKVFFAVQRSLAFKLINLSSLRHFLALLAAHNRHEDAWEIAIFFQFSLEMQGITCRWYFSFFLILNRDKSRLGRISPHRRLHRLQSNDEKSHLVRADADACTQKVQIAVNFLRCCHFHHICRKCEIFSTRNEQAKKSVRLVFAAN